MRMRKYNVWRELARLDLDFSFAWQTFAYDVTSDMKTPWENESLTDLHFAVLQLFGVCRKIRFI